jgi:hypothetical protein
MYVCDMGEDTNKRPSIQPLIWVVLAYLIFMVLLAKDWMVGGEMWAEMATNYLHNALKPDLYHQLLSTDAGYIPLPQRLIAWVSRGLPLTVIPYVYTWSAAVLSGLMVGIFALPRFRVLVASDGLRLAASILVLSLMGFGTRSFINFTYFGAFFVAVLTALPWTNRDKSMSMPWYVWFIPLLMMSKPSLLAALPAVGITALCCKSRSFRAVSAASIMMGGLQLWQLVLSQQHGVMAAQTLPKPLPEKLAATVAYAFGTLGGFMIGPAVTWGLHRVWAWLPVVLGAVITLALFRWFKQADPAQKAMAGVGVSLLVFTTLLNAMTLTTDWNLDLQGLSLLRLTRHALPAYAGGVMLLLALWPELVKRLPGKLGTKPVLAFSLWAILSGWFVYGSAATYMPPSPKTHNGYWQQLAPQLASQPDLCIPLDPFGWTYIQGRCKSFTPPQLDWPAYAEAPTAHLVLAANGGQQASRLQALAVLVRPDTAQTVKIRGLLKTHVGETVEISGEKLLTKAGGLVYLPLPHPVANVIQLELMLLTPGTFGRLPDGQPAVQWFGLQ